MQPLLIVHAQDMTLTFITHNAKQQFNLSYANLV